MATLAALVAGGGAAAEALAATEEEEADGGSTLIYGGSGTRMGTGGDIVICAGTGSGRIRYNDVTRSLEISENGGAFRRVE
jgi:hypothetical protein